MNSVPSLTRKDNWKHHYRRDKSFALRHKTAGMSSDAVPNISMIGAHQRNSWHDQRSDERGKCASRCSILQAGPPEDIKVTGTIHMPGIYDTRTRINEIIVNEHLIPGRDKVDINIIRDLKVSIHAKKTRERAIDGVMESNTI